MVAALDRKLLRDIGRLRGQVVTICLVVAAGIAGFIAMQTAYRTLLVSKDSYYETYRFGEVFASARRVPNQVVERIRSVPGVALAYPRIVEGIRIPLDQGRRAASGQIVSLPDHGPPLLNDIHILEGRMPDPTRTDEALLLEHFAEVNGIRSGDRIPAVINGTLRQLWITGLAMSPEYVLAMGGDVFSYKPGSYAVVWMNQAAIAPAFQMDGAFNDVVIQTQPGASEAAVIQQIDDILAPYGGFGAYGRDRHVSDHFVVSEMDGLRVTVTIIPLIFLAVAAFLVNVVLGRLVDLQRGQIATLKAVGYGNLAVGLHYLKLVATIVLLGSVLGIAIGAFLGDALLVAYTPYFRFPSFKAQFDPTVFATAVSISLFAAVVGALLSVRRIVVMPPAEAMRPPTPPMYRTTTFDRFTSWFVGPLGRMVARQMRRQPARLLVSVAGIAMAVAIMIIGRFTSDSMSHMLEMQFGRAMGEDLTVGLLDPVDARAERSVRALPGVFHSEGIRSLPVRLRSGSARRDVIIEGLPDEGRLRTFLNRDGETVVLPMDGLFLTDILAERLSLEAGDTVTIELLEGDRRSIQTVMAGTVRDMLGMQGYMRRSALQRMLGEKPTVSTLLLSVDAEHLSDVERRLYDMPVVSGVSRPSTAMANFTETQGGLMLAMSLVLAIFAAIIAIGIVYNNARVALSMRSRDLASMRVLGFTRAEISSTLMGELAVQVLLALPVGMLLGTVASDAMLSIDPENYRMPAVVSAATYTFAAVITMGAGLISALLVRRKLDHLDLIAVLKTQE